MTIQEIAQEMYDNFELKTRDDGSEYYATKNDVDWQRDIIFKAHLDRMPDDYIYRQIYHFLESLKDSDATSEDEFYDIIYEASEPDCYTSQLTSWLNDDNRNVYYLTEALQNYGATDGFQNLALAQRLFNEEIGGSLLLGIHDRLEELTTV